MWLPSLEPSPLLHVPPNQMLQRLPPLAACAPQVLLSSRHNVCLLPVLPPSPSPNGSRYVYLLNCSTPILASLFAGFYVTLKAQAVIARARALLLAAQAARCGTTYGAAVAPEELSEAGAVCPVCQDPVSCGVRLDCTHVFCEACIGEWLERDRTCPMCRASVRPAGLPSCGDGASPLLPQLF